MSRAECASPSVVRVRQRFSPPRISDVGGVLGRELADHGNLSRVRPGQRVVLTAGSRGVTDLPQVLRLLVSHLRSVGADPHLVPCMGSHGGGTASGQLEVLSGVGVSAHGVGAPIVSSTEVVQIGRTKWDTPVFVAKSMTEADWVLVVNRVKPHTDFIGELGSGLLKMMVVGMGQTEGAAILHRLARSKGFVEVIRETASVIMSVLPILCGVALVENQFDQTAYIRVVEPEGIMVEETRLLSAAKSLMPTLPFADVDLLVVDELGKNVSGSGMDPNVIGRFSVFGPPDPPGLPSIGRIFVRDLTPASHGNACGIGLADFTTTRVVEKINRVSTELNCDTAMTPERGRVPIHFDTDREGIEAAIRTGDADGAGGLRLVWIRNTLDVESLIASTAYLAEIEADARLEAVTEPFRLAYDSSANLIAPWDAE